MSIRNLKKPVVEADPVFRVETEHDLLDESGSRGVMTAAGSKFFVFGKEFQNVVSFKHETEFAGVDQIVITTVTIKLYGAQVETVFVPVK